LFIINRASAIKTTLGCCWFFVTVFAYFSWNS